MARFFTIAAATGLLAAAVASAQATINTPTGLIVCQPSLIEWSGGSAPYYVTVIPGGDPSGSVLATLANGVSDTSYTWTVDLAAGTKISLAIKDGTGAINYSDEATIGTGSDTSCVGASSGSSSTAAAAGSSAATSAAAAGSSAAADGSSAAAGAATTASSAAAAASQSGTSSGFSTAKVSAAGLLGVVSVGLLALA